MTSEVVFFQPNPPNNGRASSRSRGGARAQFVDEEHEYLTQERMKPYRTRSPPRLALDKPLFKKRNPGEPVRLNATPRSVPNRPSSRSAAPAANGALGTVFPTTTAPNVHASSMHAESQNADPVFPKVGGSISEKEPVSAATMRKADDAIDWVPPEVTPSDSGHRAEMTKLQRQNHELKQERDEAKREAAMFKERYEQAKGDLQELNGRKQADQASSQSQAALDKEVQVKAQLHLKRLLQEAKEEKQDTYDRHVTDMDRTTQEFNERIRRLTVEKAVLSKGLKYFEEQLNIAKKSSAEQSGKLEEALASLDEALGSKARLEGEARAEQDALSRGLKHMKKQLLQAEEEKRRMWEIQRSDNELRTKHIKALENELASVNQDKDVMCYELRDRESKLSHSHNVIEAMAHVKQEKDALQVRLRECEARVAQAMADNVDVMQQAKKQRDRLTAEIERLDADFKRADARNTELTNENRDLREQMVQLEADCSSAVAQANAAKEEAVSRRKSDKEVAEKKASKHLEHEANLEEEKVAMLNQIAEKQAVADQKVAQVQAELDSALNTLATCKREASRAAEQASDELQVGREALHGVRADLKSMQDACKEAQKHIVQLEEQMGSLTQEREKDAVEKHHLARELQLSERSSQSAVANETSYRLICDLKDLVKHQEEKVYSSVVDNAMKDVEQQLAEAKATAEEHRVQRTLLEAKLADSEQSLTASKAEVDALAVHRQVLDSRVKVLEGQVAEFEAKIATTQLRERHLSGNSNVRILFSTFAKFTMQRYSVAFACLRDIQVACAVSEIKDSRFNTATSKFSSKISNTEFDKEILQAEVDAAKEKIRMLETDLAASQNEDGMMTFCTPPELFQVSSMPSAQDSKLGVRPAGETAFFSDFFRAGPSSTAHTALIQSQKQLADDMANSRAEHRVSCAKVKTGQKKLEQIKGEKIRLMKNMKDLLNSANGKSENSEAKAGLHRKIGLLVQDVIHKEQGDVRKQLDAARMQLDSLSQHSNRLNTAIVQEKHDKEILSGVLKDLLQAHVTDFKVFNPSENPQYQLFVDSLDNDPLIYGMDEEPLSQLPDDNLEEYVPVARPVPNGAPLWNYPGSSKAASAVDTSIVASPLMSYSQADTNGSVHRRISSQEVTQKQQAAAPEPHWSTVLGLSEPGAAASPSDPSDSEVSSLVSRYHGLHRDYQVLNEGVQTVNAIVADAKQDSWSKIDKLQEENPSLYAGPLSSEDRYERQQAFVEKSNAALKSIRTEVGSSQLADRLSSLSSGLSDVVAHERALSSEIERLEKQGSIGADSLKTDLTGLVSAVRDVQSQLRTATAAHGLLLERVARLEGATVQAGKDAASAFKVLNEQR